MVSLVMVALLVHVRMAVSSVTVLMGHGKAGDATVGEHGALSALGAFGSTYGNGFHMKATV